MLRVTRRCLRSYKRVVRGSACPARYCTSASGTPCSSKSVIVVTRNEWGDNRIDKPTSFNRRLTIRAMSSAVMPFCVRGYRVRSADGTVLAECTDNHQTVARVRLAAPVATDSLTIELQHPSTDVPAALFEVRCYAPGTGGLI